MSTNKTIHVLHLVSGDLWAGAEMQLYTLAKMLHSYRSMRVSIVILNHGRLEKQLRNCGIEVIVLDESKLNGFQILRRLIDIIRGLNPDVIHTHRNKENILGTIAARICGKYPTLRTAHGAPEHVPAWYHLPKRLIFFIDRFCGRYLQHKIIAVSEDLASILNHDYPLSKIHVIENGIDVESFTHITKPVKVDSKASQLAFRVGIAGRLAPIKRVDLFIRSAATLLKYHPELKMSYHVFGDGPLRNKLEELCQKCNVENIINFEGHTENMPQKLGNLDVLLMTSDHEGMPMVLLEAMAVKTPIIAHSVGGIPTLLEHGRCGLLINEQNPTSYAEAVYELMHNESAYNTIRINAYQRVIDHYTAEQNAAAYKSIYTAMQQKT